jgi:dolichol-phosphate mannosyltransferase
MTHKIWRQGMKVAEVPIIFTERFQGRSKMSGNIIQEALIMVWRLLLQNKLRRRPTGPTQKPPPAPAKESRNSNAA